MTLAEVLAESSARWLASAGSTALRLAVLRDFYRLLHGLRTQYLTEDSGGKMQLLEAWMERARLLRSAANLPELGDHFETILSPKQKIIPSTSKPQISMLPDFLRIPLERADRDWERAIAARAFEEKWTFWSLESRIEIHSAERWHYGLLNHLKAKGVSLFVEQIEISGGPGGSRLWHGRWIFIFVPGFNPQRDLSSEEFSPEQWKLLFPLESQ